MDTYHVAYHYLEHYWLAHGYHVLRGRGRWQQREIWVSASNIPGEWNAWTLLEILNYRCVRDLGYVWWWGAYYSWT